QFDEAVEVLCYTFGWAVPPALKVRNVSSSRPAREDIPQAAIDLVHENTRLDAALYETAKQLFEAHYQQMLKDHPEKIKQVVSFDEASIANMQRQLSFQKKHIDTLQEEKAALQARLTAIESSFGWRLVLRFNTARRKVIP